MFKNAALANYHAEKSGHDQFEESTEEVCMRCVIIGRLTNPPPTIP